MAKISLRVPIVTGLTFLLALVVSYWSRGDEGFIFNAPFGLLFSMGCSVFLVVYYIFEVILYTKETK